MMGCATYMSVASIQIRINVDMATRTRTSSTGSHFLMAWRCMGGRKEGVSVYTTRAKKPYNYEIKPEN